jgi:hypothetical protein
MGNYDDYAKRREKRKQALSEPLIFEAINKSQVNELLDCEIDKERLKKLNYNYDLLCPISADPEEAKTLLKEMKESFNKSKVDELLNKTQKDIIHSIAGPFGLGKFISVYDKTGGNVTTIHNAKQGIYAKTEDEYNKDQRKQYTHSKNSEGLRFAGGGEKSVGSTFTKSQLDEQQNLTDAYTGKITKGSDTSPDHVVSIKEFHNEGGFMLNSERKADFATNTDNLASTDRSINQSMSATDKQEWMDNKQAGRDQTNEEYYDIDRDLVNDAYNKAKLAAKEDGPDIYDKTKYYVSCSALTGLNEGIKMGGQQAFGVLMVELFSNIINEIKDIYQNGLSSNALFEDIEIRLKRVGDNIASKWKDFLKTAGDGFLSGFISNIITTVINAFVKTGKRVVRLIREGFYSLLKAIKMVLFPPDGMTFQQAAHEGIKLIAAGGIIIGGVILEEVIENYIRTVPLLTSIAPLLTAAIIGSITAIGMSLTSYLIDQMDIFGIVGIEENQFVINKLDDSIQNKIEKCNEMITLIESYG